MLTDLPRKVHVSRASTYAPPLLKSDEVCEMSGLTYRQLDTWHHRGWIEPIIDSPSQGYVRLWHPQVLNEIADLLERLRTCPVDHGQEA